jgi:hypothetical protein
MKKTLCDKCSAENSRTYKYMKDNKWLFVDLCVDCVQNFVLKNQIKLAEVIDTVEESKRILHG